MSAESLLRAEADLYRRTLIDLYCRSTDGRRKTMDNEAIAEITGRAIDNGNELCRRAKVAV